MEDASGAMIAKALEELKQELKNTNQILISIARAITAANAPAPPPFSR